MAPTDLYDSVNPNAIPGTAEAVAGYIDGPQSEWPAEGWARFADVAQVRITVLANPDADAFDAESGNASNDEVAAAVAGAVQAKRAVWVYTNEDNYADVTRAMASKNVRWSEPAQWPAPGVYLWAADPSGNIASGAWKPQTEPVAVQDRAEGTYDVSTLHVELTHAEPAPAPAPQPPGGTTVAVNLPVMASQGKGPFTYPRPLVRIVQAAVGITGSGVDGLYGDGTAAAVRAYEQAHGLAVDGGVTGPQVYGHIFGL